MILKLLSARKTDDRYATVYSEKVGMYCYLVRKNRSAKYGDQGDFEVDNKVFFALHELRRPLHKVYQISA